MEKHNILGKKAEASAAFKEQAITLIAWVFILFCACLVCYFSKIGLKSLFLTSNTHFTLQKIEISNAGLTDPKNSLVDILELKKSLNLKKGADNLFEIDLKEVQKKVLQNVSIESVSVYYQFPDTIKIKIIEKQPLARLSNGYLVALVPGKPDEAFILPAGKNHKNLPLINIPHFKPGETITPEYPDPKKTLYNSLILPLKLIRFNTTFRMKYKKALDKKILGHEEFASLEILEIDTVFLDQQDGSTLRVTLRGKERLKLSNLTRLKVLSEQIELGVRRTCIVIIENASRNIRTSKIDARYSSTSTE